MSYPKNTRKCIVCREHADKSEMTRFVKDKDGNVFIDASKKADGRGVWVHNQFECKTKLAKKRMLDSAFKMKVEDEIYGEIDE